MFNLKRLIAMVLSVMMLISMMPMSFAADNEPMITVSAVNALAGESVDVKIDISNNPGIISMLLDVSYEGDYLALEKVTNGSVLKGPLHDVNALNANPYTLSWGDDTATSNNTANGTIVTFTFKVADNAPAGALPVTVTYDNDNAAIYDKDMITIDFEITNGSITVTEKPKEDMKGLSFKGATFTYDGTAKSIAVAGAPQDAKVSYAIENETVVYDSISKVEAGTYNVTATVSASGYNTETLKAVLTINPKPVTVTGLKAEDKTYDGTRDAWVDNTAATISGKVGDDDVHVGLPQEGEFASANAGNNIEVIIEELKLAGEDAHNYTLTQPKLYANINKVAITVTGKKYQIKVGADLPKLAEAYEITDGKLVGNDTFHGEVATDAKNTTVGTYKITKGTLALSANYELKFVDGEIEIIDKTPQTITVAPVEAKTYGDADFEIEVTEDSAPQLGEFTYEVSEEDQKVVTVSENGTVTIVGAGKATVTVKRNGNDDFATLEVPVEIDVKPYKITAILDEATKKPVLSGVFESDLADVAIDFESAKTTVVSHEPISESAIKTTSNVEVRKLTGTKAANYTIDTTVVKGVIDEITVMEEKLTEDENVTIEAAQVDDKTVIVTDVTVAPEAEVETVTIDVTAIADTKVNTVAIPKETVDAIDTALEITLKDGSAENKDATIFLDADALASVKTAAGENATTISISVDKQEKEELETEQATKVEEVAAKTPVVFSLSITDEKGNTLAANFGTGKATVKLPYEKPAINGNVLVKYLADNGTLTDVANAIYDAVNKFVEIALGHFSEYLIYTEPTVVNNNNNGYTGGGNGGLQAGGDKDTSGADKLGNEDKTETTVPEQTPVVTPSTPAGFADLGNHAWAADAIANLVNKGIIKGTSATTYSPAKNIIRADFVALVVRMFNLSSADTANFADVNASDYFAAELAIAKNNGIVGGIGDNKFAPRGNITRQDMMVMLYRAMQKLGIELNGTQAADVSDMDTVSEYAKEAVEKLTANGIINGKNGKIDPKANATRAEVAVMLNRVLDLVK